MKKIIIGAAVAAILSTSAFSSQILYQADIESGVFDHMYVETAIGVINGNNDGLLTIGNREYTYNKYTGAGLVDLSATGSMEKQFDLNARYTTGVLESMFVFGSVGAETYTENKAEVCSGELIDDLEGGLVCTNLTPADSSMKNNVYGEIGTGILFTNNWVVMGSFKVGTAKKDFLIETSYEIESDIYMTVKIGQSFFDTENDNQHDDLTTLVGIGYSF